MTQSIRQTTLPGMDGPDETFDSPRADQAKPAVAPPVADAAPPDIRGWTVYVVDSHSLIFQVFHAMKGSELTSPKGEPVGAVYGFTRDLVQLLQRNCPTALACAFDLPGPTFRHGLYDGYKADRGEMPADLVAQIPKIRQVVEALGIPIWQCEGFEADDVLATAARQCEEAGAECLLVTSDKDCRQLIGKHVRLFNIRKETTYGFEELAADWGILPQQVVDFQALIGDPTDCVPGVPSIGPKAAKELLDQFGSLQGVYDRIAEVKGPKRQLALVEHRDKAILSRQLVELDSRVPVQLDWNAARTGSIQRGRLAELMREFGFRSLADRVLALAGSSQADSLADVADGESFDTEDAGAQSGASSQGTLPSLRDDWNARYHIVDTPEKFAAFMAELAQQAQISLDTETTSISPRQAEIVGYAIAWKPGEAYYLPVRGPAGEAMLDPAATADALRPILENPAVAKIGQNLKYDMVALRSADIQVRGAAFDTMVASYLLDAGERTHNLDELARKFLDHETIKIDSLIGSGKNQKRMDQAPIAAVGPYAAEDADVPLRLLPILEKRLVADGLDKLNSEVEVPLIEVLADLEHLGIRVDVARLHELSLDYSARLAKLREEIEELAGHPLNIDSPKQLAVLLFSELKLPVIKKTKTGASTDASVLEELAPLHPLPAKIVEYRQYAKLLGTYIDALPEMVLPETGRVHASLNQVVAATGRLSSSSPNLQNIPVRTREGREIRSAFTAGQPLWSLLAADYSQIELRVLAHYCGDAALCAAFANDEDVHQLVASQVHDVPMDQVTKEMRRDAKAVNFGIIYGQSPFGLAKGLGISQEAAAAFIETYFRRYPGVLEFFVQTLAECHRTGCVKTLLGRRRSIDGVRTPPAGLREPKSGMLRQLNLPERTAVNAVIQGSAADLIKVAMIRIHRRLKKAGSPARMLLQIHDELLFETPPDAATDLANLVREEMSQAAKLAVPLKVDVKLGPNWAECEAWE